MSQFQPHEPILVPRDLGGILDQTFKVFGRHWRPLISIGLASALPMALWTGVWQTLTAVDPAYPAGSWYVRALVMAEMGDFSDLGTMFGSLLLVGILFLFLSPLLKAAQVHVAVRAVLNQPAASLAESLQVGGSRYLTMLGALFMIVLLNIVAIPLLVLAGLVVLAPLTVMIGLPVLYVFLVFTAHAAVVEKLGSGAAIGRSFRLVKSRFWPLLGLGIVFGLLMSVLFGVINLLIALPLGFFTFAGGGTWLIWVTALLQGVLGALLTTLNTVGITLAYFDTRIRTEGYDLEMMAQSQVTTDPLP